MLDKSKLYLQTAAQDDDSLNRLFQILDIDFPAKARIPLFLLRRSFKGKRIHAVYLTDGSQIYGYIIYQRNREYSLVHILYLAVLPQYRSEGVGSVLLEHFKNQEESRIILDAEDPLRAKDEKEKVICQRRIDFYENNGYHEFENFKFVNFGYYLRVMTNGPLPAGDWLKIYRRLYDNAYGLPVSWLMVKPYK